MTSKHVVGGRGAQARVSDIVKALKAVGFEDVPGSRHRKVKHPETGIAFTLPLGGGSDPKADGIFVSKARKVIEAHEQYRRVKVVTPIVVPVVITGPVQEPVPDPDPCLTDAEITEAVAEGIDAATEAIVERVTWAAIHRRCTEMRELTDRLRRAMGG